MEYGQETYLNRLHQTIKHGMSTVDHYIYEWNMTKDPMNSSGIFNGYNEQFHPAQHEKYPLYESQICGLSLAKSWFLGMMSNITGKGLLVDGKSAK